MSVIHEYEGEDWIFAKGGAGGFKTLVKWKVEEGKVVPIADGDFDYAAAANKDMASKAMRVIALCARKVTPDDDITDMESMENDLIFLGMVGIMDPPRAEVYDAILRCQSPCNSLFLSFCDIVLNKFYVYLYVI